MKSARLSLRTRLLLTVLLPVSLLLAVVAGVSVVRGDRMTASAIAERGLAIVSFLAPAAEYGVISGNAGILGDVLAALRAQKDVVAATLYDREGNVLAQGGSPRLLDAAADLGASSARAFFTVVLPNARVGIAAGAVLVGAATYGAYIEPALLGGASGQLAGNVIAQRFVVFFDWGRGSALAMASLVVIIVFALLVLGLVVASGRIRASQSQ